MLPFHRWKITIRPNWSFRNSKRDWWLVKKSIPFEAIKNSRYQDKKECTKVCIVAEFEHIRINNDRVASGGTRKKKMKRTYVAFEHCPPPKKTYSLINFCKLKTDSYLVSIQQNEFKLCKNTNCSTGGQFFGMWTILIFVPSLFLNFGMVKMRRTCSKTWE